MTTDTQLVIAALDAASDEANESFAALYDRYADRIHTFCYSRLRNDADAADALRETWVRAHRCLEQLADPATFRPWLFAIARTTVVDIARARGRHGSRRDWGPLAGRAAEKPAALLWDAAAGMQPVDQELLELHLREGMEGTDLALAMDVEAMHVSVMVKRMKTRLSTAVGSLLVARLGREACAELDGLLADWDGRFSLAIRSTIARHVDECDTCHETRRAVVAWESIAAALPASPAPLAVRPAVMAIVAAGESAELDTDDPTEVAPPTLPTPAAPTPVEAPANDSGDSDGRLGSRAPQLVGTALSFVLAALLMTGTALAWPVISSSGSPDVVTEVAGVNAVETTTSAPTTTAPPAPTTSTTTTSTTVPPAPPPFAGATGPIVFPEGATSVDYTLTNNDELPLSWAATTTAPFAFEILGSPSPRVSGTLISGTSITLRIVLDPAAAPGDHAGAIGIETNTGDVEVPLLVTSPRP